MQGRADKGIIVTTGSTIDAKREAVRDGVPPIEFVDGEKLVGMIEQLELGLTPIKSFTIDESFFNEFGSQVLTFAATIWVGEIKTVSADKCWASISRRSRAHSCLHQCSRFSMTT